MTGHIDIYPGRRVSYDGALCTVRCRVDEIPGTKGEWLGVEWDDPSRGKHHGTHNGVKYFQCRSSQPTVASFVRPTRKRDPERTILEAIRFKYVADQSSGSYDPVVISGKVAEEVGFDKIIKAQSELTNLKIVILDSLAIYGVAPRGSNQDHVKKAQEELAFTCPNVVELDLSHNPIETWADVEDICSALPNLRVLRLDCVRFRDLIPKSQTAHQNPFINIKELHLNESLLSPTELVSILSQQRVPKFPVLESLWLSQNELSDFNLAGLSPVAEFESIRTLMLENNLMTSLDPLLSVFALFPRASLISLQSNKISSFGKILSSSEESYHTLSSLNLSNNNVSSFLFVDQLPRVFPNMSALRISGNPVYSTQQSNIPASNRTETSYYLTLARIPHLESLNYTEITPREREEGEIYYLSITEKEIHNALTNANVEDAAISTLAKQYQRYNLLCAKYDRDNIITQLTSSTSTTPKLASQLTTDHSKHPPGSLASRLITSTFILTNPSTTDQTPKPQSFTRSIPGTISTSSVFSLVSRELHLPSLSFRLVYESEELDPVRDDTTTRSQLFAGKKRRPERWDEWGDWDADAMVEMSVRKKKGTTEDGIGSGSVTEDEGKWTDDGVLIKDGRKWRKREVEILFGMKSWGDWLESGIKSCRIRVERVDRKSMS